MINFTFDTNEYYADTFWMYDFYLKVNIFLEDKLRNGHPSFELI